MMADLEKIIDIKANADDILFSINKKDIEYLEGLKSLQRLALENSKDYSVPNHIKTYLSGALYKGFKSYLADLYPKKEPELATPKTNQAKEFLLDLQIDGLNCAKEHAPKNWFDKVVLPDLVNKTEVFRQAMLKMTNDHFFIKEVSELNALGGRVKVIEPYYGGL